MNNHKWWWWWWCRCYNKRIVDNYPDDEEVEYANLQTNEETEPSDEEEINELASGENQFQETNNSDESNDDTDAASEEEEGKVLNEYKGDRQVEDEIHDEVAEEETDDQDQKEEEDNEGEDTDSIKMYVKNIIPFDDDERNPHATSSPKGKITIMLQIVQSYCWLCYKAANIINCIFAHFS